LAVESDEIRQKWTSAFQKAIESALVIGMNGTVDNHGEKDPSVPSGSSALNPVQTPSAERELR
jgi:hypothetical protein